MMSPPVFAVSGASFMWEMHNSVLSVSALMASIDTPPDGQIRRNCDFYDPQIFDDLANFDERSHRVNEFLKCMALCNTVVPHFRGSVGGLETLLPATLVQSWMTSGTQHTTASGFARSMGTGGPISIVGQRQNPRSSAATLRDAGAKTGEERGAPSGGNLWQMPSVSSYPLEMFTQSI